ncbi:MAG: hypothetical protein AAGA02_12725 [Bacteroidota bacterium]
MVAVIYGVCFMSCSDEEITPLRGGDEDEDPIETPPPPPPLSQQHTSEIDLYG